MKNALDHMYEVARICAELGLEEVVISPGSRSAPLGLAFARHKSIRTHGVPHEGSAAFQAMGMAMATGKIVGLVCTSGTAGLHYAPALAEAQIQQVPILVLTADRPAEWIHQEDGQTIPQDRMYGRIVKQSYVFPDFVASSARLVSDQLWHLSRILSEAFLSSCSSPAGPVHINIPLRPPLYEESKIPRSSLTYYRSLSYLRSLTTESWKKLSELFEASPKVLLLGGQCVMDQNIINKMMIFCTKYQVPALGDIISNLHGNPKLLRHMDLYLDEKDESLRPDLLISFGGTLLSKEVKSFFRKFPPPSHLRIAPQDTPPADTLQCLTHHLPVSPTYFFSEAITRMSLTHTSTRQAYCSEWQKREQTSVHLLKESLKKAPFGQFRAVEELLSALPYQSILHLGNSMPIRYAQYVGLSAMQEAIEVYANRGTCGIDGCLSTSVGVCKSIDYVIHTLFIGDISFLHDQAALMSNPLPAHLRIVLFNDHGGGIFKLLPARDQSECTTHFVMPHQHKIEALAEAYHLSYQKIHDLEALKELLPTFFQRSKRAKILEIETDTEIDQKVFQETIHTL